MLSGAPLQKELRAGCCREDHPDRAIADCVEAKAVAVLAEEFDLRRAVVIDEEYILVRLWWIAALNNVVG